MGKSPGHRQMPDHKVEETRVKERVRVEVDGEVVADSADVIKVDEDGYPPRYYFPRADVKMEKLERTDTMTKCPFKGTAHYFSLSARDAKLEDVVWTYEDPYEEHRGLTDRLAFWEDKEPRIHITPHA